MREKHLICRGATVYCTKSMINNNPGTAIPLTITSNMVVELNGGKVAATDKDCTPANMCFGNCNTGTNPPPPCIANVQWSKCYENAEVTEAGMKFLTEESEATCMTFGGKVKIAFHGQSANPQPEELKNVSPQIMASILPVNPISENTFIINESDEKREEQITDAYWIDGNNTIQKDSFPDFPFTLYVKVDTPIVGKRVDLNFKFEDSCTYKCAKYSGTINSEGIIVIENFKFETEQHEEN